MDKKGKRIGGRPKFSHLHLAGSLAGKAGKKKKTT
jgi:hypothetical protein